VFNIETFTSHNNFQNFEKQIIESLYEQNPTLRIERKQLTLKFALLEVQINELLNVARSYNVKHARMIETQLNCGLRVNEIVHLSIDQVNIEGKYLRIEAREKDRYVDKFVPKTKCSNRIIPLSERTANILREQIGKRKKGYVFPSNKGGHYNKTSVIRFINKYARICKTIRHNIGSHSLRRTFASYLISDPKRMPEDRQITISDICRLLGHKSIKTTMEYLFNIVSLVEFEKIRASIDRMHN